MSRKIIAFVALISFSQPMFAMDWCYKKWDEIGEDYRELIKILGVAVIGGCIYAIVDNYLDDAAKNPGDSFLGMDDLNKNIADGLGDGE
jgi:hypothetical protein